MASNASSSPRERYRDRSEAGRVLAADVANALGTDALDTHVLDTHAPGTHAPDAAPPPHDELIVLGLPRGGVPVASVVAGQLGAPLDVLVVRKIGVPSQPEVAMGAIASVGGDLITVRNDDVVRYVGPDAESAFDAVAEREKRELERREQAYREGKPALNTSGRTVIIVDDGLATGATMRAAVEAVRATHPRRVVVAVPIGSRDTCLELEFLADTVVCSWIPDAFWAVGQGYHDFTQTTDDEVQRILADHARRADL